MPSGPPPPAPIPPPPPAGDPPGEDAPLQAWGAFHLREQAAACARLDSPLYARILSLAADDVDAGGPAWDVLDRHTTRDRGAALALRFMAALHRLVLTGRAPALAAHYPSVGGVGGLDGLDQALRTVLAGRRDELRRLVGLPCQTNEVARSAALAVGHLLVARETGLPLRLLEVGASGGLNLRWDRYRYGDGAASWGPPDSPVQLDVRWDVPRELAEVDASVVARAGCDPDPLDPCTEEGRLALTASVWADQVRRLERLRAALRVARDVPVDVARARVRDWLPAQLVRPVPGVATIVYHSVVWQYLAPPDRDALLAALHDAAQRATPGAPLAWLRMEPDRPLRAMAVDLTSWPLGTSRRLARAGAHGDPVEWIGPALDDASAAAPPVHSPR